MAKYFMSTFLCCAEAQPTLILKIGTGIKWKEQLKIKEKESKIYSNRDVLSNKCFRYM